LKRPFPDTAIDNDVVDILWFRLAPVTGYWSLLVPIVLLAFAVLLAVWSARELLAEERKERAQGSTRAR
jgi:cell division protein FtsL